MRDQDEFIKPQKNKIKRRIYSPIITGIVELAVLYVIIIILSDHFFRPENIQSVLSSIALLGMLALAESLVFLIDGIDLSVTSVYMLSSVLVALCITANLGLAIGILLGLLAGITVGVINGILIAKIKIQSVIATLSTLLIVKGLSRIFMIKNTAYHFPKILTVIAEGKILFVPISLLLLLFISVFCFVLFKYTIIGRQVFAVGGNEKAAKVSGLNVDWIKISIFIASGLLASFAGIIFSTDPSLLSRVFGLGDEFEVILVVLIGGVGIFSRTSFVMRTLVGTVFVVVVKNLLTLNFVSHNHQVVISGFLMILFAAIQCIFKKS